MRAQSHDHRIGLILRESPSTRSSYYAVDIPRAAAADRVSELDVSVLHREILQGELGLGDELIEEERHISYTRDVGTVLERVATGTAQKSTYYYPKPASGIVFNPLDPAVRIPAL